MLLLFMKYIWFLNQIILIITLFKLKLNNYFYNFKYIDILQRYKIQLFIHFLIGHNTLMKKILVFL